jgi:hypothetical protein
MNVCTSYLQAEVTYAALYTFNINYLPQSGKLNKNTFSSSQEVGTHYDMFLLN